MEAVYMLVSSRSEDGQIVPTSHYCQSSQKQSFTAVLPCGHQVCMDCHLRTGYCVECVDEMISMLQNDPTEALRIMLQSLLGPLQDEEDEELDAVEVEKIYNKNVGPVLEEEAKNNKCSVCIGENEVKIKTSCGHYFCDTCLKTWMEKKISCPMCRHEFSS